jgi:hypothetical protein
MEHMQFKSNQTAAAYVAHELSEEEQEAFELHMMGCSECVSDVEAWRAIKRYMPDAGARQPAQPFRKPWWGGWGIAASFVGAICVSGLAGWFAHSLLRPDLDSTETAIFNMPAVTRGVSECTKLPVAANARAVVLRVPGIASDHSLVATNEAGHELSGARYSTRQQRDGSWVLRFDAGWLQREAAYLVSRNSAGADESLGCVVAAIAPPAG